MDQTKRATDETERAAALADRTDDPKLKGRWQRLAQSYQRLVAHITRVERHAEVRREENERRRMPD